MERVEHHHGLTEMLVAEGTSDCELRDDWLFEQDVNAWSSLAYAVAGFVLAWEVARSRLPKATLGLAIAAVAEAAGSVLYHGHASDLSQFLHDVPLIGALGFVAGWHVGRLRGGSDRGSLIGLLAGAGTATVLWAVAPDATNVAVVILVVPTVVASLMARRRGLAAVWSLPLLILGVVALASWALGTPSSPLCDEQSWFQPHGVWHVLTAVAVLAWVDRAYAAADPDRAPRMFRRFTDRTLGVVTIALVMAFHRSVDITHRERFPTGRPVLVVANHANGFVDPILVASILGRLPRFLAKAALWKVVVARPFLAMAGVLPVYRTADGDRASDNRSVFAACHEELAQGAAVAIFPEGTTGDRAGLDRVKSGAARIALGAVPTAPEVVIVPIGMAFESRVETRSRAAVMFGDPILVADYLRGPLDDSGEAGHEDVQALTDRITTGLEAVAPSFADMDQREIFRAAARVERADALGTATPGFGEVEEVARHLATASAPDRATVMAAYRDYATRLQLIGIRDTQLRSERVSRWRLALSAAALFFAGSLLLAVTLIHLPALLLVVIGTGAVRSTATKGTVRLLLGLVAGLATWIIAGAWLADGWAAVAMAVAIAAGGAVALAVWRPIELLARRLVAEVRVRDRIGLLPPVLESRSRVTARVRASIGDDHV